MYTQIHASGADAASFLQSQLTQDLARVGPAQSPLAAWCNPQGRVIVVLRVLHRDDGIGLLLPAEMAGAVVDGLLRYRLRARVELSVDPGRGLAVAGEEDLAMLAQQRLLPGQEAGASCRQDGVTAVRPIAGDGLVELWGDVATLAPVEPLDDVRWAARRIVGGIADIGTATRERYTPHMLNLDRLAAISFSKGCYPGQEIVARTQHRGTAKRRIAHYRSAAPLAAGQSLSCAGKDVGEVVAAAGHDLLALLPLDLHGTQLDDDVAPA